MVWFQALAFSLVFSSTLYAYEGHYQSPAWQHKTLNENEDQNFDFLEKRIFWIYIEGDSIQLVEYSSSATVPSIYEWSGKLQDDQILWTSCQSDKPLHCEKFKPIVVLGEGIFVNQLPMESIETSHDLEDQWEQRNQSKGPNYLMRSLILIGGLGALLSFLIITGA